MPSLGSQELEHFQTLVSRLSGTSSDGLFSVVPSIASNIANCHAILSKDESVERVPEETKLLQKFDNRLSQWLEKGGPSERWAAVVLVKAAVEAGGVACLQRAGSPWSKRMLQALSKSNELPTVQRLMAITLTRMFLLTKGVNALVRELTTPCLPQFINTCMTAVVPKAEAARPPNVRQKLLPAVLKCFARLLPNHPTIFRTVSGQLRSLLQSIIFPCHPTTSKSKGQSKNTNAQPAAYPNPAILRDACYLFCLLPLCAPKDEGPKQWEDLLKHTILEAHAIADSVFKPIIEDWRPLSSDAEDTVRGAGQTLKHLLTTKNRPFFGTDIPTEPFQGCLSLRCLLLLLSQLVTAYTPEKVNLRLGSIVELVHRISLVTALNIKHPRTTSVRFNRDVPKEERETLFAELPKIHEETLHLICVLCDRLGSLSKSMLPMFLELMVWIFEKERFSTSLRAATYRTLANLLDFGSAALSKTQIKDIYPIIAAACNEFSLNETSFTQGGALPSSQGTEKLKSNVLTRYRSGRFVSRASKHNAGLLLISVLTNVPGQHLQQQLRAHIDKISVFQNSHRGLLASILSPTNTVGASKLKSSVLPFLARSYPRSLAVEAIIRPRMPVLAVNSGGGQAANSYQVEPEGDEHSEDDSTNQGDSEIEATLRDLEEGDNDSELGLPSDHTSLFPPDLTSRNRRPPHEEMTLHGSRHLLIDQSNGEGVTNNQNIEANTKPRELPIPTLPSALKRSASPTSATSEKSKKLRYAKRELDYNTANTTVADIKLKAPVGESWRTGSGLDTENPFDGVPTSNPTQRDPDEDDADFEIPTLNPDPDTEDETDGGEEDVG